jgi:uncharacterized protein (TIGR01319 family)
VNAVIEPEKMSIVLVTDCGSTTSKARLFKKLGKEYRFIASGETPTTVEAPYEDITIGVRNAIREVEELTGLTLLTEDGIVMPSENEKGVDLYLTTSSAGGGLQMMVAGVIRNMTAESAERASLGAGSIVMNIMSTDDGRPLHDKIREIRQLRPDMVLIAGGTDGGAITQVVELAEVLLAAGPKARLGSEFHLPVVFAGNKDARDAVGKILDQEFALKVVENIRPTMDEERPGPAREAIHELFMEHVMSHAPGYDKLMKWTEVPIMPTPGAEALMFQTMANAYSANVLGVGLGGATTNVYSKFDERFVRTVSANLGMSYSICNVLKESGIRNIIRWLPFRADEIDIRNRLWNKMVRPTTIPQTLEDLMIEHAVAREAIRLGFHHHKSLARPLRGVKVERDLSEIFEQRSFEETYIDLMRVDWIAGTGGLLSHAPRRAQSALMLIDAFQPEGITRLAQDSVFMIPHLGILSQIHPGAAMEIFEKDCLVKLGTCIAPKGLTEYRKKVGTLTAATPDGIFLEEDLIFGSVKKIELPEGNSAEIEINLDKGFDVGAGPGHSLKTSVEGGEVGIIIDTRGRPLMLPEDEDERRKRLVEWFAVLEAYTKNILGKG